MNDFLKSIRLTGIALLFTSSLFAQWSTQYDNFTTGSLYIGSPDDNTTSVLKIQGPNRPLFEGSKRDLIFSFNTAGESIIRAYRGASWGSYLQFITSGDENQELIRRVRMHIDEYGHVGIGTVTPAYTLTVNGTIQAKEILVEIDAGADHVFKSDYNLPSLSEINTFVHTHHHLPDIPSAHEMKEKGIDITEFQIKLLQKIEELTLHVIRQEEEIQTLKKQLEKKAQ